MTVASNRQKKLLKFFGIKFDESISIGAAGWEISGLMSDENNVESWKKYLYLTKDFSSDSSALCTYDIAELEQVVVPENWDYKKAVKSFQEEIAEQIISSNSPYDMPEPEIDFSGTSFCLSGKFELGKKSDFEKIIVEKGGTISKSVSSKLDYLIVGSEGSSAWKRGSYGSKIEKAILLRRERGNPAIISEKHCLNSTK